MSSCNQFVYNFFSKATSQSLMNSLHFYFLCLQQIEKEFGNIHLYNE